MHSINLTQSSPSKSLIPCIKKIIFDLKFVTHFKCLKVKINQAYLAFHIPKIICISNKTKKVNQSEKKFSFKQ